MTEKLWQSARRLVYVSALILAFCAFAFASQELPQTNSYYNLSMPQPSSHLFQVSVKVEMAPGVALDHLDFQMPRWSPGRYAIFDFAKNVQEFQAFSALRHSNGNESVQFITTRLPVVRVDDQTWRVETRGNQAVDVVYKVFGDDLS